MPRTATGSETSARDRSAGVQVWTTAAVVPRDPSRGEPDPGLPLAPPAPLIALTEQKFHEMQASAVRWGFKADDVGLVTGNRRVNPNARVLVVVAEILLNRLLHPEGFTFEHVSAVVMDEFHSFADMERGIVWELSLNMLPKDIRLLLLSATVGNSVEFMSWLDRCHGRKLELVESRDRKIPLTY